MCALNSGYYRKEPKTKGGQYVQGKKSMQKTIILHDGNTRMRQSADNSQMNPFPRICELQTMSQATKEHNKADGTLRACTAKRLQTRTTKKQTVLFVELSLYIVSKQFPNPQGRQSKVSKIREAYIMVNVIKIHIHTFMHWLKLNLPFFRSPIILILNINTLSQNFEYLTEFQTFKQ